MIAQQLVNSTFRSHGVAGSINHTWAFSSVETRWATISWFPCSIPPADRDTPCLYWTFVSSRAINTLHSGPQIPPNIMGHPTAMENDQPCCFIAIYKQMLAVLPET